MPMDWLYRLIRDWRKPPILVTQEEKAALSSERQQELGWLLNFCLMGAV